MEKISFNNGYKEYKINDDENAVIRINTTDMKIIDRANEAKKNFNEIMKKYEDIENQNLPDDKVFSLVSECDRDIREQINYIFGSDVCTAAFGNANCISPCGGQPLFMNFINAIIPLIEKDIAKEQKLSAKKIEKYTSQAKKFSQ